MMNDIDVVIPMVFQADENWKKAYLEAARREGQPWSECRYRSTGLEALQLDLIRKHMPWVNRIFILLAMPSQRRDWMMQPNVVVVYHDQFIPKEYCPAFSSYTIEMFLHRIPGLSDNFIYFNDDMFPVRYVPRQTFFRPCHEVLNAVYHPVLIEHNPNTNNSFWKVCYNNWILADRVLGIGSTNAYPLFGHGPNPMSRSTIERYFCFYESEIKSRLSTFRRDYNLCQYLWLYYELPYAFITSDAPQTKYISNKANASLLRLLLLSARDGVDFDFLCYNDNNPLTDDMEESAVIREFLLSTL